MGRALALFLLVLTGAAPAWAGRFAVAVAFEAWPDDTVPGHGIGVLAYDFDPWLAGGAPSIVLDTDTVRLGLTEMRLGDDWRVGVELAGEVAVAGLLTDHYVDGRAVPERGFFASYAEARGRLKRLVDGGAWAELTLTGRRWFFDRQATTADDLVLPPDTWVLMPRLHLGWWRLSDDAGWRDRHRLFPRLRGVALGVDLGLDLRSDGRGWGRQDTPMPGDRRNAGGTPTLLVRQWMRIGVPLGERARAEVEQRAGYGVDEDDLTRARVGGMNPYVVQVPGAPWAAWLAGRFVGARMSLPFRIAGDVELGPAAGIVMLQDSGRTGDDDLDVVLGAGATLDARFGNWQVDLRGGVSPSFGDRQDPRLGWSAYLGVGWGR